MPTIQELLAKLVTLSGPCPNICDETIPLGGSGGTQTVDIKTGLPVTQYPPSPNRSSAPESSGTIVFDGVSQYVVAPNAQVINWLPGTGDFTIEWFMKKGSGGSSFPRVFSLGYDTSATIGCSIEGGTCYIWPYTSPYLSGSMPAGYNNSTAWTHIAVCRSGTTVQLFIDGSMVSSRTDNRNINDSINSGFNLNMGVDNPAAGSPNWWSGGLTNFRWTNSAVYTGSSLTVPTSPLTILPQTKLLMLGGSTSNPVSDSTGLNTLTNNGATWSSDTPF